MPEARCDFIEKYLPDLLFGKLVPKAARAVQRHLEDGCEDCRTAIGEQVSTVSAIALIPSAPAPANLKTRLVQRIRENRNSAILEPEPGLLVAISARIPWEETGLEGIRRKLLHRDAASGNIIAIIHMDAGVRYPSHRHAGLESLFMLSGALDVSGVRVRAGDLCLARAHTQHDVVHAIEASEFFVISNDADEVLLTT